MFTFPDEDGDMIAFSTDDELMMGLTCIKDDTFRLFIKGSIYTLTYTHTQISVSYGIGKTGD